MSLIGRIIPYLAARKIPCALIGADALAVYGVARATIDQDLLAVDGRVLDKATWSDFDATGLVVDIRRGDSSDPLRGVVRITPTDLHVLRPLDLIVGRHLWQERAIARARIVPLDDDIDVPVVEARDLVLLKLDAGGVQDLWDIERLLASPHGASLRVQVEEDLSVLSAHSTALWKRLIHPDA